MTEEAASTLITHHERHLSIKFAEPPMVTGTEVRQDGVLVKNVRTVTLSHPAGDVPRVYLEIIGHQLEVGDYQTDKWFQDSICADCKGRLTDGPVVVDLTDISETAPAHTRRYQFPRADGAAPEAPAPEGDGASG